MAESLVGLFRHSADDGLPDGAQQVRAGASVDDILHELADVEIECDQIVGAFHLAVGESFADREAARTAFHVLPPGLGGQRAALAGGGGEHRFAQVVAPVEHPRLGVLHAGLDEVRQRGLRHDHASGVDDADLHRGIQVAIRVLAQQTPDRRLALERHLAPLARPLQQMRKDRVLGDVLGDVFPGVIGPHLLLVDVLLEDVAQYVGVDLVARLQGPVVEVPVVAVEETEQALEGRIGYIDVGVGFLQLVHIEQSTVQIRYIADQAGQIGRAVGLGRAQPLVEQAAQEQSIKGMKPVPACLGLNLAQAVGQIVGVAVQKTLALDEVDEHQAIQHQRGVPLPVGRAGEALDERGKALVFGLEAVVKSAGNTVAVEGATQAGNDVGESDGLFRLQRPDDGFEFLPQRFAALASVPGVGARGGRLTGGARNPQPSQRGLGRVGENQQMLVRELGGFLLDLQQRGARRDVAVAIRRTQEHRHAAFLRDGPHGETLAVGGHFPRARASAVPAEFVEQRFQPELVEQLLKAGGVDGHVFCALVA